MTQEKNKFGGIATSLYTPMSEDEQEAVNRIIESGEVVLRIKAMGKDQIIQLDDIVNPPMRHGDARVQVDIDLLLNYPVIHVPVYSMELSLLYKDRTLFKESQSVVYDGQPIMFGRGGQIVMKWDIQVQKISPELVKLVKKGAFGLTTRDGNTYYDEETNRELREIRAREEMMRLDNLKKLEAAKKLSKEG